MHPNRFFALFDCDVKLPASGIARGFIAHEKYRQEFGIIVFVRTFLGLQSLFIGFVPIIIGIVFRRKGLPKTRTCRVLLRRASDEKNNQYQERHNLFHLTNNEG